MQVPLQHHLGCVQSFFAYSVLLKGSADQHAGGLMYNRYNNVRVAQLCSKCIGRRDSV